MLAEESSARQNGYSLMKAAEVWTRLERIDERLAIGDCPLPGCNDREGSFTIFRNMHSEDAFRCEGCGHAGDLRDFMKLVFPSGGIEDIRASEVTIKPVRWLWNKRIPLGKLTIFDGDPDLGKSVVTIDVSARVSTGRAFPDGAPSEAGNVLIVNVEDGVDDTIVPRLKAHGADLDRVYMFSSVPDGNGGTRLLELPQDIALLENKVMQRKARLLIIDPVLTMLGGDANKDQEARKAMAPIRDMAERTGVAVVAVRHLNKSVGLKAIQRGGGNMGLIGVARAGSFFAEHPDDDRLRVMAPHKSNLAEKPPSLSYQIVSSTIHNTARVEWRGTTDHDANSLAASNVNPHERSVLDDAKEFLLDELKDGPVWAKQVYKDARDAGHAEITIRRAKTALRIKSERCGTEGWAWRLPDEGDHRGRLEGDDHHDQDEHVDQVDHLQGGASGNSAYFREDDHGDQDDQGDHGSQDDHVHLPPAGVRLTAEEVERVKELRRSGLGAGIARARVLSERGES
jgi:hypothetical protein